MADVAASDVSYTLQGGTAKRDAGHHYHATFLVEFGDGALTYPSGGIPLTRANLGCPNHVEEFMLQDPESGDGLVYKYDYANETVRIYEANYAGSSDGPLVELDAASDTIAATDLYVKVVGW